MTVGDNEFLLGSIKELSKQILARMISPVEVTKHLLNRIETENPKLNAYITIMHEEAMKMAKQAEAEIAGGKYKGPLHGVPIGLKDIIYTQGIRTTMGSEIFQNFIPNYDATVVTRLKNAGAVIVGKLNTHQFAYGPTGDRSFFGPARNPHNLSKITGGSSSGSGAAVAAGLCYGALGTDSGGSIRIPAACCGLIGMKPTFGRVSKYGVFPLSWTLDHVGPLTRTVEDNIIMLENLAGHDPRDSFSLKQTLNIELSKLKSGIKGKTIGLPRSYYFNWLDDEVQGALEGARKKFRELGAEFQAVDLPHINEISAAHQITIMSEAYTVHEERLRSQPDKIEEEVRNRLLTGILPSASEYIQAQQLRRLGIEEFNQAFREVDIILTPAISITVPEINQRAVVVQGKNQPIRSALTRLTGPTNLTGLPSLSVPCGFDRNGMPIGMQLIGKHYDEQIVYQFAYAYEQSVK